MGLCITLSILPGLREADPEGYEWNLRHFEDINRVLLANGLPTHEEPEERPAFKWQCKLPSQPYSWLHYLRRAVAYALRGHKKLPKFSEDAEPTEDPMYDSVLCDSESHVICHSDCEGFYVPIDFPDPLYDHLRDKNKRCLPGGILGSSQGALRELVQVAPLLGIRLTRGKVSQKLADELNLGLEEEETASSIARIMWFQFFEIAQASIEHKTAIVFG